MDPVENMWETAQELISHARAHALDLMPLHIEGIFRKDERWIWFWRKDSLLVTGPAGEKAGTLHYNMQGAISRLPNILRESASAFQGMWSEAGTLESVQQALELAQGWLLDGLEVDDLPKRWIRRSEI